MLFSYPVRTLYNSTIIVAESEKQEILPLTWIQQLFNSRQLVLAKCAMHKPNKQ